MYKSECLSTTSYVPIVTKFLKAEKNKISDRLFNNLNQAIKANIKQFEEVKKRQKKGDNLHEKFLRRGEATSLRTQETIKETPNRAQ